MERGETTAVTVGGEVFNLPLTMAAHAALARAGLCPMYLAQEAALKGRPFMLDHIQACQTLAIGLRMAGVGGATADTVWQAARRRDKGTLEVWTAAMDYMSTLLQAAPQVEAPPAPEGGDPKA